MKGFKDFIMQGNLVELAVAFIMASAFGTVVTAFTKILLELIAKAGGTPNFDDWAPGGIHAIGPFLTAAVAFLFLALIVYFFVVKPYEAAKARYAKPADEEDTELSLLAEIRDELVANRQAGGNTNLGKQQY